MEVITIESQAFRELTGKIDKIFEYITNRTESQTIADDDLIDNYEVCTHLRISDRTLQRLRSKGIISYVIITGKVYYTMAEVKRMVKERLVKRGDEYLEDLKNAHQDYLKKRRDNKPRSNTNAL
jgi:hypothetical protein